MRTAFIRYCAAMLPALLCACFLAGCKEEGNTVSTDYSMPTALIHSNSDPTSATSVIPETESTAETFGTTEPTVDVTSVDRIPWYETNRLIYHAAGEIGGFTYTNSREAIENRLEQGNMLLEIDFLFTSDGHLVCLHEWQNLQGLPGPCTLERFLSLKIYQRYTTITAAELIEYMRLYPDMYLIVDTKEDDCSAVVAELLRLCEYDTAVADRFVIQLYDRGIRAQMQALYPFEDSNFLFTTYKFGTEKISEIVALCREENITVITVPYGAWDKATVQMMNEAGFILFEHTLNYTTMTDNAMGRGVYGFYTDSLQEADLNG